MPIYETVFIARQDLSQAQVKDITQGCEKVIGDFKGKILKTENWGLRSLAYKINKNRKGHYVLIESDVEPAGLLELERTLRLNEDVLRYMSLKEEQASEKPSAILDTRSNDESDEREAA